MTTNELQYQRDREERRANLAEEAENVRTHKANEAIGRTNAQANLSQAASAARNADANVRNSFSNQISAYAKQAEVQHKKDTWLADTLLDFGSSVLSPW